MATKQFYATGSFRYGTRMMKAGDPVEMDAPTARLFDALGKITASRPRARPSETIDPAAVPAPIKAPRKRKARK